MKQVQIFVTPHTFIVLENTFNLKQLDKLWKVWLQNTNMDVADRTQIMTGSRSPTWFLALGTIAAQNGPYNTEESSHNAGIYKYFSFGLLHSLWLFFLLL